MGFIIKGSPIYGSGRANKSSVPGVIIPDAWTWTLPFKITNNGDGSFSVGSFNLKNYAGISVTTTYYVKPASEGGNDGNSGADEANALATLSAALAKGDVDRIYIKAGTYYLSDGWNGASPARDLEVIGYGGTVLISMRIQSLVWAAVDAHWKADVTGYTVGCVTDNITPDADGDQIPLEEGANVAAVDAAPGLFYQDGTDIHVHTLDSREPDSAIYVYNDAIGGRFNDPNTWYIEGIDFHGARYGFFIDEAGGAKFYAKDCTFKYNRRTIVSDGFAGYADEFILQDCVSARNSGDGFKMSETVASNTAYIDCISRNNGIPGEAANNNAWSRHGPGSTVLINCVGFGSNGRTIHDVNDGTLTWMLGCNLYDPLGVGVDINYAIGGVNSKMWLDTCISGGAANDVEAGAGSYLYYRNMSPTNPVETGAGTFGTY